MCVVCCLIYDDLKFSEKEVYCNRFNGISRESECQSGLNWNYGNIVIHIVLSVHTTKHDLIEIS